MSNKEWVFHTPQATDGLHKVVSPENSDLKHLVYSRLWLSEKKSCDLEATDNERGLVCLNGKATVLVNGESYTLQKNDTLYLPWHLECTVKNDAPELLDVVLIEADAFKDTEVKLIKFEEVKTDPERFEIAGSGVYARKVYTMIDQKKVDACRLIVGLTCGNQGAWTSWPPHDHTKELEELYLYHELPEPGFVVQICLNSFSEIDLCEVVKEGDVAIMPRGGHPTVAAPNAKSFYLWAMAAHNKEHRRTDLAKTIAPF